MEIRSAINYGDMEEEGEKVEGESAIRTERNQ
jgi:hypothetical protein